MKQLIARLLCKKGQGTIEYALATVLVITILLAFISNTNNPVRQAMDKAFQKTSDAIE